VEEGGGRRERNILDCKVKGLQFEQIREEHRDHRNDDVEDGAMKNWMLEIQIRICR
jgi:hypothetical protein